MQVVFLEFLIDVMDIPEINASFINGDFEALVCLCDQKGRYTKNHIDNFPVGFLLHP
jgi:hypothetical protein